MKRGILGSYIEMWIQKRPLRQAEQVRELPRIVPIIALFDLRNVAEINRRVFVCPEPYERLKPCSCRATELNGSTLNDLRLVS